MSMSWIDNVNGLCPPPGSISKEELRKREQELRDQERAREDVERALADDNLHRFDKVRS